MLKQWRFKVCDKFATLDGEVIYGDRVKAIQHTKPFPERFLLYKPTARKYDYVDYSGRILKTDVEIAYKTCELEFLGYIKFISSTECDEGNFI